MTFQPRMHNRIEGFSVIGGGRRRLWNGVAADLWDVDCAPGAGGYYVGEDPRLFIALETRGGDRQRVLLHPRRDGLAQAYDQHAISYVPAGMELWSRLDDIRFIRHLDLHFDQQALARRLGEEVDQEALARPRLMFSDDRLIGLARLIAAECENPDPLHDLYGDGLTIALLIDVLQLGKRRDRPRKRSQLAAWQLRKAIDYIEENCFRSIRLQELAELTGLSQSHFGHAFKASTGMPPHRWQMNARMDRIKDMLLEAEMPLTGIAITAGFSDQAHFTRVFRQLVGATPSAWQRARRGRAADGASLAQ
ncbi:MAG: helix-turn-helix domain-containing protein [Ferrovibrionaceae bacterium]